MRKHLWFILMALLAVTPVVAQQPAGTPARNYSAASAQPYLSGVGTTTLSYSAGLVYTPAKVSIVAGTLTSLTASQGTCTAAAILAATDACEYIYWHSSTGLSKSVTYATAAAAGNVIVGFVTTDGSSNVLAIYPATAVGPLALPATAANLSGNLLGTSYFAGSVISGAKIAAGECTLGSTCASVTLGPTFTSGSTYACSGNDVTGIHAFAIAHTSATVVAITGNSTDVIDWVCVGN